MNPYDVLELAPGADNKAVVGAATRALRARRHDARTVAEAQRVLLDSDRRLLADFMLPAIPVPRRLDLPPECPDPGPPPPWPEREADTLLASLEALVAADREAMAAIPRETEAGGRGGG